MRLTLETPNNMEKLASDDPDHCSTCPSESAMTSTTPGHPLNPSSPQSKDTLLLPKITITYCTQCRWLLRAAYYAQELLSSFPDPAIIGEVALRPATGGTFHVEILYRSLDAAKSGAEGGAENGAEGDLAREMIWERKRDGGFPETKVLKQLVRDRVQPGRGLGHSDRKSGEKSEGEGELGGSG